MIRVALPDKWIDRAAVLLAALFVVVISWHTFRQYETLNLRAPDVATFYQAIWNTLHGRFLYATIIQRSVLAYHFSPFLALLSPLLLVWNDVRILFLAQTIGLAAGGLLLYRIVRPRSVGIALVFLLAYYLNPSLHEIALHELRRVIFAVPFLALALVGLHTERRWLMAIGLFLALLCKENISLVVFMVGVYLLVFKRDWRWGLLLTAVGAVWAVGVTFCVIPTLRAGAWTCSLTSPAESSQLNYFSAWRDENTSNIGNVVANMLASPAAVLGRMFDPAGREALWRVFLPLGLVLPFLAPDWLLITLPVFGYTLTSSRESMHRLENWYLAPIFPVLLAAVAVALTRLPQRWVRPAGAGLLISTLVAYGLHSQAPLGGAYDPGRYALTPHHALAREVAAAVPDDAGVAAQDAYLTRLAGRQTIHLYPWFKPEKDPVDFLVFDRRARSYPLDEQELNDEIDNLLANPDYTVRAEANGIFVLQKGGAPLPAFSLNRVAEEAIRLERVEIAPQDDRGFYRPAARRPVVLTPGQRVRVTLYWEAVAAPQAERTVSVRVADQTGWLWAQQDMLPGNGTRPTSWWEPGWYFRDVYYLTLDPGAQPGEATIDLLLYDTYSLERVPFGEDEVVTLSTALIER